MHEDHRRGQVHAQHAMAGHPYRSLFLMAALAFVSMFVLMYAMVDGFENIYLNLNQLYMAGLMTGPMILIEVVLMRAMYPNRRWNTMIAAASVIASLAFFMLIRQQAGIGNRQFLRSMIPHHASALLMCQEAPVTDPEVRALCQSILAGQQSEIDLMRSKLNEPAQ